MRKLWVLYLWPVWSYGLGCAEAGCHLDDREEGERRIAEVRAAVEETGEWPVITWWTPRSDPLAGWLDFGSLPWVSAARGSGDCDDAMLLAEEILEGYETRRAFVWAGSRSHAMLLWKVGSVWYIISNMVCQPTVCLTPEDAARIWFGDATTSIIID